MNDVLILEIDIRRRGVGAAPVAGSGAGNRHFAAYDGTARDRHAIDDFPDLPFDHNKIVEIALQRLKGKVTYEPIGFELLPKKFTLFKLQKLYETILEQKTDKRNFRKKILGWIF